MKAFRLIYESHGMTRINDWVLKKAGTEPFSLQSVKKKDFLIMVMCYRKKETAWRQK